MALPRLLGTSGKETILAVRSSQSQEAALTARETYLHAEARLSKERLPLKRVKATVVTWCDQQDLIQWEAAKGCLAGLGGPCTSIVERWLSVIF